jgi:hypothetical protein
MKAIKGLRIDFEGGAGEVELPAEFQRKSALFRADVLGDWYRTLRDLYDDAVLDLYSGYRRVSRKKMQQLIKDSNQEILSESKAALALFSGRTVKEAKMLDDGGVLLIFTDGGAHAMYQTDMHEGLPVMASPDLREPLEKGGCASFDRCSPNQVKRGLKRGLL